MFGSLLGAVRDGEFIKGSGDIDIGFIAGSIGIGEARETLVEYALRGEAGAAAFFANNPIYFNFKNDPIINCQVFYYIDGKAYFIQDDGLIQGGFDLKVDPIWGEKRTVEGVEWLIPNNYEELLEEWYGKDWRIPKKGIHATLQNYKLTPTTKENEEN